MKKNIKVFLFVAISIIVIVCLVLIFSGKTIKVLENIDVTDIENIEIYYSGKNMLDIDNENDIQNVVKLIQSMKLKKISSTGEDGYMPVRIYYKNGDKCILAISSNDIIIDGEYYKPDRDYYDDFQKICDDIISKSADE